MVDVMAIKTQYLASLPPSLERDKFGFIHLRDATLRYTSGVTEYSLVEPTMKPRWIAAHLRGTYDESTGSVRVRVSNGTDRYWLNPVSMKFEKVTVDEEDWGSQYNIPCMLGNLDLWTEPKFQLIVRLASNVDDRDPIIETLYVVADFPMWEGPTAQALREVVRTVSAVEPVLIVDDEPSVITQSWKIGGPHTERSYDLKSIEGVTVDGIPRQATLSDGVVTIVGPPAPARSAVRIAVRYRPTATVRRVGEVKTVHKVPAWWVQDLVTRGTLSGRAVPIEIAGYRVYDARVDLRITVNGIADRTADSLAMRAALLERLSQGITVVFPSGRCVTAHLDGLVEVLPAGQSNLPMATGIIHLPISEYVSAEQFRKARGADETTNTGTKPGKPIYTSFSLLVNDGTSVAEITSSMNDDGEIELNFD